MEHNNQETSQHSMLGANLKRAAAAGVVAGVASKLAHADVGGQAPPPDDCVVVQFYLRGGADGLTLCVPLDEPNYHARRTETRVYAPNDPNAPVDPAKYPQGSKATLLHPAAGGRTAFGLAPALAGIKDVYDDGDLCFVHAVGSKDETRSHFVQQSFTERGETSATSPQDGNGWLGRYLANHPPRPGSNGSLRALAFGTVRITSYGGGQGITPTTTPDMFEFPGPSFVRDNLEVLYTATATADNPFGTALANDLAAVDKLDMVDFDAPTVGTYPDSVLGTQFKQAFHVIRDDAHIEVITIDYDNIDGQRWDTHNNQGVFVGTMANLMDDVSQTLTAFMKDLNSLTSKRVVVLVYTEFGRTLQENDGLGTDHGRGGVAMLMGREVIGGRVYTDNWPTLADPMLDPADEGDLAVDIDLRDLQAEVIHKCLGADVSQVFPDTNYTPQIHNLLTENGLTYKIL